MVSTRVVVVGVIEMGIKRKAKGITHIENVVVSKFERLPVWVASAPNQTNLTLSALKTQALFHAFVSDFLDKICL